LKAALAVDDGECRLSSLQVHRAWRTGLEPANIAADSAWTPTERL